MNVTVATNPQETKTALVGSAAGLTAAAASQEEPLQPVLGGENVTVLPPEMSEQHYEAMRAVAENLKPSEKETQLKKQRQKEVREKEDAAALREKEDLKKAVEQARTDAQNRV